MRLLPSLALASLVLAPSLARANGRFPASTQLVFHPQNEQQMLLRTTFGLLQSLDDGAHFSWICEKLVGYGGTQDPAVALTGQGALLVAAFEGLAVSQDGGCSFAFVPEAAKEFVIDVAVDRNEPSSAVAVTSTGKGESAFYVQVLETLDAGKTWANIGVPVDPSVLAETIDAAPSRKQRLYVSGFASEYVNDKQIRHGVLMVSDDRGQSWIRRDLDLKGDKSVYIAAVDPALPDRVYLRTRGEVNDRLLRTDDAGASFTEVTAITGSMLGFALSPDGTQVAIGGPSAGLLVADTTTLAFTQRSAPELNCLAWNSRGLYACGNPFKDGFSLARSTDQGTTFVPLLASFTSLSGPLAGCATNPTPAEVCAQEWAQLKTNLGIQEGAGAGGSGGSGQGGGGASTAGLGGTAGTSPGAGAAGAAAAPGGGGSDDGCGCAQVGRAGGGLAGVALLALGSFLRKLRTRRTRLSPRRAPG